MSRINESIEAWQNIRRLYLRLEEIRDRQMKLDRMYSLTLRDSVERQAKLLERSIDIMSTHLIQESARRYVEDRTCDSLSVLRS